MRVSLSPIRSDDVLLISAVGNVLTINGTDFDFSPLEEGGVLPRDAIGSEWFIGDVTRRDGEICVSLLRPHGPDPSEADAFPEEIVL